MKQLNAVYRIVTPMFLGNQSGVCDESIRPTSFKGGLRFWWRALNWSKCWVDAHQNEKQALKLLYEREGKLFGLVAEPEGQKMKGGQGLFLLAIENHFKEKTDQYESIDYEEVERNYGRYLAYGMQGDPKKAKRSRDAIKPEQTFKVTLLAKPRATQKDIDSVKDALIIIGLLGGLGAKSRKGFGSLSLESLEVDGQKVSMTLKNIGAFQQKVREILQKYPIEQVTSLPPYTAFSQCSYLVEKQQHLRVLAEDYKKLAGEYKNNSAKKFLGLPRQHKQGMYGSEQERRASPVLFHIFKSTQGQSHALVLFLPAQWKKGECTKLPDYQPLTQWLDKRGQNLLQGGQTV